MAHRHTMAARNLALSPLVGAGCILGGAALGAACVVGGTVAGVTAPVWYTKRGYRQGKELDEMEALLGAPPKRSRGRGGKKTAKKQPVQIHPRRMTIRAAAANALRAGAGLADETLVPVLIPKEVAKALKGLPKETLEKIQAMLLAQKGAPAGG